MFCSLTLPTAVLQLGGPPGHHGHSRVSGQDWLRCIGGVSGLVLGQDSRLWPRPVDAADRKNLGVHGLPHPSCPLHPDQEAHPHSGENRATRQLLSHEGKSLSNNINAVLSCLLPSVCWPPSYHPFVSNSSFTLYCFFHVFLFLCCMCLLHLPQHTALSEYRPILANRPQSSFFSMADMKLTLIPIIFIVLRIWSTVRFVLLLADSPVRQNPVLVTLHVSLHVHTSIW